MKRALILAVPLVLGLAALLLLTAPQAPAPAGHETGLAARGAAPAGREVAPSSFPERSWAPVEFFDNIPNSPIDLADVPTVPKSNRATQVRVPERRPEMPISEAEAARLREASKHLSFNPNIQILGSAVTSQAVTAQTVTGSLFADNTDASQACNGCGLVPPDPEMAAGPNHLVATTNIAFAIYDRATGARSGPFFIEDFFAGVSGCTGVFDPNILYDESADRFIMGIDGNGTAYCVAVSQTGDPNGAWNRYSFSTTARRSDFFDYPHAGVGADAIYLGANIFGKVRFKEGRVWAMDKNRMYNGLSLTVVSQSTGGESTPQPQNLHGFLQGTFPTGGPQYIMTDDQFNGTTYGVWSWSNPFGGGGGTFTKRGVVDLVAATGVPAALPIDVPQASGNIQANDWRVQDAEYRNGHIWISNTIACNPGGGTVDCARWAEIDPVAVSVVDAGVFATPGEYRTFADVAADHCGDMALGYSKLSGSINPSVFVTGRQAGDPAGTVQAEVQCQGGQAPYTAFDTPPRRWGDYSGMTVAPDGVTFFYLGEYSKSPLANPSFTSANWGTAICQVSFPCTAP